MKESIKKIVKYTVAYPYLVLRKYVDRKLESANPSKLMQRIYKRNMGMKLNLRNPKSLDDKIYYLSYNSDTQQWSNLADKVKVRDYVIINGLSSILCKLYGVYNSSSEIDYGKLPEAFVMKTNNASATTIIVKDKNKLDKNAANEQLDAWLKVDYGKITATPHYSKIEPKILIEEYLHDDSIMNKSSLADYKFYCINGRPEAVMVYTGRIPNTHIMKRMMYDMNWEPHEEWIWDKKTIERNVVRPFCFEEMKRIVEILAHPFVFVRVDLYLVNNKIYFGEMTFTPGHRSTSETFQKKFGALINISNVRI